MALSFKIFSLVFGLVAINIAEAVNEEYPLIGEKYYRPFLAEKVNWYRANHLCAAVGMQLASIESQSDLKTLRKYLFRKSLLTNNFWLAGNNLADRGEYTWLSSGRKLSNTKWAFSQPGTLPNRCVVTDYNFDWVSDDCSNSNYFICSKLKEPDCGIYGGCTDNFSYMYPEN